MRNPFRRKRTAPDRPQAPPAEPVEQWRGHHPSILADLVRRQDDVLERAAVLLDERTFTVSESRELQGLANEIAALRGLSRMMGIT